MNLILDWSAIRTHFNKSFRSNFHITIASVDSENRPTVTPIGSLFLNDNQTGFYFEKYPSKLPLHAMSNRNICALGVNSSLVFWLRSLFTGKFNTYPAIKLYGELGEKRIATDSEAKRFRRRMKSTRGLKGHKYLWGDMNLIREVNFIKAEKINLGKMTSEL